MNDNSGTNSLPTQTRFLVTGAASHGNDSEAWAFRDQPIKVIVVNRFNRCRTSCFVSGPELREVRRVVERRTLAESSTWWKVESMTSSDMRYGCRSDRELEALWALETSIASVAARFKGEDAFNFSQEVEIAAHLMVEVRAAFGVTEPVGNLSAHLTRMEWRCLPGHPTDMVLVHPDKATEFRQGWGSTWATIAKTLPLLAAIEIKRGGGNVTTPNLVSKDLRSLNAIADSDSLGHPVTYFLCWVDSALKRRPHQSRRYREVKDALECEGRRDNVPPGRLKS